MESGVDTSGMYFVGIVLAVVAPLLFIAFALARTRALAPAGASAAPVTRMPRPGYRWGIATGAALTLAAPSVLEWLGAPGWTLPIGFLALLLGPLILSRWIPARRQWFAAGLPWGMLVGWFALPLVAILALPLLQSVGL